MKYQFIELHSPMFHVGKNFKEKVHADLETSFELITVKPAESSLEIPFIKFTYKGKSTNLPLTSINHAMPLEQPAIVRPVNIHHDQDVNKIKTAQVSTPIDHVFQGPGKGKGVGRPAKVQGE